MLGIEDRVARTGGVTRMARIARRSLRRPFRERCLDRRWVVERTLEWLS